jgi:1-acyl-sn-glycerol-3-phosphate acyltransferase
MPTPFIRALKGAYMALMFAVFGVVMLAVRFLVLPVVQVVCLRESYPIHAVNRRLLSIWLRLLALGGLVRSTGIKGKPVEGPCVIVANHPGLFDVLFLFREIPELSVMVKPSLARRLPLTPILRASGYVTGPEDSGATPLDALLEALVILKQGRRFLVFPEGTRSPAGALHPFKPGAFTIARKAGVPIQPVLFRNRPPFLPHEEKWYYPGAEISRLELEFLSPIPPPAAGEERQLARELEERYRELLG